jgi:hypothetical protein
MKYDVDALLLHPIPRLTNVCPDVVISLDGCAGNCNNTLSKISRPAYTNS